MTVAATPRQVSNFSTEELEKRVKALATAASDGKLVVFMDFDRTTSRCFHPDGRRVASSAGIIETSHLTSQRYRDKGQECFDKYYPIEIHADLPDEEKIPRMEEWYKVMGDLTVEEGLTDKHLEQMVADAVADSLVLREGVAEFINHCQEATPPVPVLIVSAGLGNTIEKCLRQTLPFPLKPTTQFFSNWILFNENGVIEGFSEPQIHMFNKNARSLPEALAKLVQDKSHALLLGDSPGDSTMADGLEFETLKVAFLNEKEERLAEFQRLFDVIVLDDPPVPELCFRSVGTVRAPTDKDKVVPEL
mmetsp:Transcript_25180/g.54778  ORF Transcript_25180/g.54778 Transcript_25180/m.54778 type:complete len:305 (+) Transcript_25180:190-1104(+)|eukprot:CAMPEP_0206454844 /NCGR_PEP_ID=MMETSP0324_2-20121206/21387_1 /ASSEMBLY_ACC=CAM_ASM_000836 /TAXON_ID=2866 /ORGANISM="Crypthecodinium cohnii, Strain Seligo" /LENGTH=304 /DNA_ID=CAMNT_0053925411 /DNA_START=150 /DNA_END=1064 /DNA_ORIENTATION=+